MNIVLWSLQIILAFIYGAAGVLKTFLTARAKQQLSWAKNRSDSFVRFVGISELLGALGLILPVLTGILAWLTPLAAIGLTLVQILAIFTEHLPKKEYNVLPMNIILAAVSAFIVFGRWTFFK